MIPADPLGSWPADVAAAWLTIARRLRLRWHSAVCTYCRGRDGAAGIHLAARQRRRSLARFAATIGAEHVAAIDDLDAVDGPPYLTPRAREIIDGAPMTPAEVDRMMRNLLGYDEADG